MTRAAQLGNLIRDFNFTQTAGRPMKLKPCPRDHAPPGSQPGCHDHIAWIPRRGEIASPAHRTCVMQVRSHGGLWHETIGPVVPLRRSEMPIRLHEGRSAI